MDENDKILITAHILQPELDPEEGADYEDAFIRYLFVEFLDGIGREDFKEVYMNMINEIRGQSIENQIVLCQESLERVKDIYEFVLRNKAMMPRPALRYAIEKMPQEYKAKAME